MVGLGFGWREALLSTPVFAAVIRGACYFEAASIHALTHTVKHTERALSGQGVQYRPVFAVQLSVFSLVRKCECQWKALNGL